MVSLAKLPSTGPVSRTTVDAYRLDPRGPKVGETTVFDPHLHRPVVAVIRASEAYEQKYRGCVRLTLSLPRAGGWDRPIGDIVLRYVPEGGLRGSNAPKLERPPPRGYGHDPRVTPAKVFIENMTDGHFESTLMTREHRPSGLRGVGTRMHQLAAEWSLGHGCEGRVQLQVAGTSLGFHEMFGFTGQDVHNADGSLHHRGQSLHEQLAIDRFDAARDFDRRFPERRANLKWKKEWVNRASQREVDDPNTQLVMFLPDEVIARERSRSAREPILQVNVETALALVAKHSALWGAVPIEEELARFAPGAPVPTHRLADLIERYHTAGDPRQEAVTVRLLAECAAIPNDRHEWKLPELDTAAKTLARVGDAARSRALWIEAGELARSVGWWAPAREYFANAGDEARARSVLHDSFRDW